MKAQYLLLFGASLLLINPVPTLSSAAQIAYATRTAAPSADAIYQRVNPAVVTVYAGREIGSGSIVSPDGMVITNNHVVREVSTGGQVSVRTAGGRRLSGQVIATDSRYDLALIQLAADTQLPTVAIASQTTQAGEPVFAIGSPYGRPGVMTTGTFSSARSNGDLQSRVVLQPGNSGGPLLNAQGEMIGINKAILESARGSNTGISIATSAPIARQFIEQNHPFGLAAAPPTYSAPARRNAQRSPIYQPPTYQPPTYQPPTYQPPSLDQPSNSFPRRFPGDVVIEAQPSSPNWGAPNSSVPSYPTPGYSSRFNRPNGAVVVPQETEPGWRYTNPQPPTHSAMLPQYSPEARDSNPANSQPPIAGARLGVIVDSRTLVVQQVEMGSAAAQSGLRVGDRLIGANGNSFTGFDDLQSFMQRSPSAAEFTINRNGRPTTVDIQF